MAKSTATSAPRKPRPDFPLFVHQTGRWAKKVRGKLLYFGKTSDDPNGERAVAKWLDERDELLAGRTPRKNDGGLTVADLVNSFLTDRKRRMDAGDITARTFSEYHKAGGRVIDAFGRTCPVESITTDDFAALRETLAKTRGPIALGNEIQRMRTLFKFGFDNGLMEKPIRYGVGFDKPPAKSIRNAKAAAGPKMFTADEIRAIIKSADPVLKSMILLGVNCALGAADISGLPRSAVDLQGGWIDFARVKTGVPRRCALWPETVAALSVAIDTRPTPKDPADGELCLLTARGKRWVQLSKNADVLKWAARQDHIAHAFRKVAVANGLTTKRGFYSLRRTFQTIGEDSGDFPAVSHVMGHAPQSGDMSATYRQRISDERLRAVADVVHDWLFGPTPKPTKKTAKGTPKSFAKPAPRAT